MPSAAGSIGAAEFMGKLMQRIEGALRLSATDLVGHLNCAHLTSLDLAVALGNLDKPAVWDPLLEILWERGERHEQGYVEHLQSQGLAITVIEGVGVDDVAIGNTRQAMKRGDPIIVQGAFRFNGWVGRTDVLKRIDTQSDLGAWSYEVVDTKLARETKGGTVLQLCLYADLLASVQGLRPEFGYVVAPWSNYEPLRYRMDDYAAYFRRIRAALEASVALDPPVEVYPEPKEHCDVCRWQNRCDQRRRADDHLSLVAGITKVHIDELGRQGVHTLAELAAIPLPLQWKPERGSAHSYERIREQARLQLAGRMSGEVQHELLPIIPGLGLAGIPQPSPGDIFFDLEGDPFAGEGGLEYLFGYAYADEQGGVAYNCDWALSREAEKEIFERFIDFVMQRLTVFPDLHIFHFAPYEPAALKRLMGRYASREEEIDSLLRSKRLVDLYGVVRNSVRASVESYSIKKLEPLYGYARETPLSEANKALAKVQAGLELGDLELIDDPTRAVVAGYNRDDCLSTWRLRDWLETKRSELIETGVDVPRPEAPEDEAGEALTEWQERIATLIGRLTHDVPIDVSARSKEQQARWLLAHTLDWHRRERKALWWEYFRLSDLSTEDLFDERAGLSGLVFLGAQGGTARAPIHRYSFPAQDMEMRSVKDLRRVGGKKLGTISEISLQERWIDIKKRGDSIDIHPDGVFVHTVISAQVIADSLVRLGEYVADHGIEGKGPYLAARDLLLRHPPRIGEQHIQKDGEEVLDAARRLVAQVEGGFFPIQGPPGSGKTYTGARMICALVQAGRTVGICANSHKVIRNLLNEVVEAGSAFGIQCIQKVKAEEVEADQANLRFTKDNPVFFAAIGHGAQVAGGTAWLWSSTDAAQAVDVLFIDEAAQMSLADVLAVAQSARSVVLLGDPQQLEQPVQGSHPDGVDVSALHHVLGDAHTIAQDRGLFLEETWRLHPLICSFTSEVFYAGRLHPHAGLDIQGIHSQGRVIGTGLRHISVATRGNQSSSPEEAEAVKSLVEEILAAGTTWVDRHGVERTLTLNDILIIAPYNAQVFELQDRIPGGRIGTVDKFQGQEAPMAIYSMTTSSHADAPRGMEFLYSLNRLNVATSRAKCLCILVASPSVFEAQCRTPRQMQLANAFCRYLELSTEIERR